MNRFKIVLLTAFVFCIAGVYAQETTNPHSVYPILINKMKRSDEAIVSDKKKDDPKTWISRADMMMDIYEVNLKHVTRGMPTFSIQLTFGDPLQKTMETEDNKQYEVYTYERIKFYFFNSELEKWKETDLIYKQSLEEALRSLEKAEELDVEKKQEKQISKNYERLVELFRGKAAVDFNDEDFETAFNSCQSIVKISDKMNIVDTMFYYYAGIAALKTEDTVNTVKYMEKAREYQYDEPFIYTALNKIYFARNDSVKGLEILNSGFKMYPDNQVILIDLINYYLNSGEAEEAMEYLELAIKEDPTNVSFYFAKGTLYDKLEETEKAMEEYQKCIEMDPTYFNAYYNLGVMYYNKAVILYNEANEIMDNAKYQEAKNEADEVLIQAIPYVEKAYELNKQDMGALETLKTVYYRLQTKEAKYKERYEEVLQLLGE